MVRNFVCSAYLMSLMFSAAADAASTQQESGDTVWLHDLDVSKMTSGYLSSEPGKSVEQNALRIAGRRYERGVGTHAVSEMWIELNGDAEQFVAQVGVDDEVGTGGSVIFGAWVDGKPVASTPVLHCGDAPTSFTVPLSGAKHLVLTVDGTEDGIDYDHANWAEAHFVLKPGATRKLRAIDRPEEPLPDIIHRTPDEPRINGPGMVGTTPRRPFLFLIPATGKPPLAFSAKLLGSDSQQLPAGLKLDAARGIISGALERDGTYAVEIKVTGPAGTAVRQLTIIGGEGKLALTPPMGWNSWNVWGVAVDQEKVRASAEALISSGLAAHGYSYINIDDAWSGKRNPNGEIQTNDKFPDMKSLADHVHSLGLKIGIYSSPGPKTCGGFEGSYGHEKQDALTYARWGMDYLKYDWCSYSQVVKSEERTELMKPFKLMRQALEESGRDVVLSICQYGLGEVWEWGPEAGGNLWRTSGDILDSWGSVEMIGFGQEGKEKYSGPGHWNDPDMLVLGRVGWGSNLHPTRLNRHEQITHMSLWCLLAAPLLIGCDLTELDPFTLALLTNDEVIAVNQDALGKQAALCAREGRTEVWARPLEDGSTAVGLFNRGLFGAEVKVDWRSLKITGRHRVRDLWQRKELGEFDGEFSAKVAGHGAMLIKVSPVE